jgi:uncharacterized protein YjbJ (UPF0337 family)
MGINKEQVKGRVHELEGAIKETIGKIVGDAALEAEGSAEKNIGKVRAKAGDLAEDVKKPSSWRTL